MNAPPAIQLVGSVFRTTVVTAGLIVLTACASASMAPGNLGATRNTGAGQALVDAQGMTLYTYDPDPPGQSTCTGMCAMAWPPVRTEATTQPSGGFTVIARPDGSRQWAYNDKPLYGYFGDRSPGDTAGDGVDGVWHVAHP